MAGLYIHIPFCIQKCSYCDFLSFDHTSCSKLDTNFDGLIEKYVDALLCEMDADINTRTRHNIFDTVYFGGGTPTALPSFLLCKILKHVQKNFTLAKDVEITVEANPGTLSPKYLADIKAQGVTRLSFGLQATQNNILHSLGRLHTMEIFLQNYIAARAAGFGNISVDLMFALPGQTLDMWESTLDTVIQLAPEHISTYSLTPAEDTPLYDKLSKGLVTLPGDDTDRDMYHLAREKLTTAGYIHYEISNFARGKEKISRHNENCWRHVKYYAFGIGAHSFDGKKRWHNTTDMDMYLAQNKKKCNVELLSDADIISEKIILGLRMIEGVEASSIPHTFLPEVEKQIAAGLLEKSGTFVRLTPRGMDLANQVYASFLF